MQHVLEKLEESQGAYPTLLRALNAFLIDEIPLKEGEVLTLHAASEASPCSM